MAANSVHTGLHEFPRALNLVLHVPKLFFLASCLCAGALPEFHPHHPTHDRDILCRVKNGRYQSERLSGCHAVGCLE